MAPVTLKQFRKFLKSKNLIHKRTSGGHEIWNLDGDESLARPITFPNHHKEVPRRAIKSNLETMGCTQKDLDDFLGR